MHKTLAEKLAAIILGRLLASVKDEIRGYQEDEGIQLSDMEEAILNEIIENKINNLIKEVEIQL